MKEIKLTKGKTCIVDDKDYEWLSKRKWQANVKGSHCYAWATIKGRSVLMHRLLLQVPKGMVADHINHNGLDNRRQNLRLASYRLNRLNSRPQKKGTHSGYKGVYFNKTSQNTPWKVQIKSRDKIYYCGTFANPHHAALVYDLWAKDILGKDAILNFNGKDA